MSDNGNLWASFEQLTAVQCKKTKQKTNKNKKTNNPTLFSNSFSLMMLFN